MPIDFPNSPSLNQQFTADDKTWQWDGVRWEAVQLPAKSAYDIAVDNGFTGTEAEWLASLVGADGAAGADGAPGADGAQGPQGDPGPSGSLTRTIRTVSESTTLVESDQNQIIRFNGTSAQTLTIPDVLEVGSTVTAIQDNSGSVEFVSGQGVNLLSKNGIFLSAGQNSTIEILCVAAGEYRISRDIATSVAVEAIGGTITTDGTYQIHTFTSSGTFEITSAPSGSEIEYFVMGGGGAGSGNTGAGTVSQPAGGSGYMQYATIPATVSSIAVVIGAGGAAANGTGSNGSASSFGEISVDGGFRGVYETNTAGNGGSGGSMGAKGLPGGVNGADGQGVNKGLGSGQQLPSFTPTSVSNGFYGGGSTKNASRANGDAAAANTGGGGGGSVVDNINQIQLGGAGGSGIAIIRYTV